MNCKEVMVRRMRGVQQGSAPVGDGLRE